MRSNLCLASLLVSLLLSGSTAFRSSRPPAGPPGTPPATAGLQGLALRPGVIILDLVWGRSREGLLTCAYLAFRDGDGAVHVRDASNSCVEVLLEPATVREIFLALPDGGRMWIDELTFGAGQDGALEVVSASAVLPGGASWSQVGPPSRRSRPCRLTTVLDCVGPCIGTCEIVPPLGCSCVGVGGCSLVPVAICTGSLCAVGSACPVAPPCDCP